MADKSPVPRRRASLPTYIAWGCLAGIVAVLACAAWFWVVAHNPFHRPTDLDEIAQQTGLVFPASTRVVRAYDDCTPGEGGIIAKLETDPGDVDRFLRSLPRVSVESRTSRLGMDARWPWGDYSWWDPTTPQRFAAARGRWPFSTGEFDRYAVLVSLDDPEGAVVYFWGVFGAPLPGAGEAGGDPPAAEDVPRR